MTDQGKQAVSFNAVVGSAGLAGSLNVISESILTWACRLVSCAFSLHRSLETLKERKRRDGKGNSAHLKGLGLHLARKTCVNHRSNAALSLHSKE